MSIHRISKSASILCLLLLSLAIPDRAQDKDPAPEPVVNRIAFANVFVKSVLSVLGKNMKLEVTYDTTVRNEMVELEMEKVTITQAMTTLFEKHKLRACLAEEEDTILVFADTEENRKKYARCKPWPVKREPEK